MDNGDKIISGTKVDSQRANAVRDIFAGKLGPKYTIPREIQQEILNELTEKPLGKVTMLELPTGCGKSAIAVALGELLEIPFTVINTATISLQGQYDLDFPAITKLIGRGNFKCTKYPVSAAEAPCLGDTSIHCDSEWYEQEEGFRNARKVVTNYALYLSELLHGQRFHKRRPTLLVCDEGHRLLDFLSQVETVRLSSVLGNKLGLRCPGFDSLKGAQFWAKENISRVRGRAYTLLANGSPWVADWMAFLRQLEGLVTAPSNLITTKTGETFEATPLWPKMSAHALLDSADKVLVMSATLWGGDFFAELLGFKDFDYYSAPSPFDSWRWPVYYRPVRTMNKASTPADWAEMGRVCHEYMHSRARDKGIIHVASKDQANKVGKDLLRCSSCRTRLVLLRAGKRRAETIEQFRRGQNTWIIHPSIGEGESFDDEDCRIQLIAKVRYPDLSDPLVKMRVGDGGLGNKFYFNSTAAYTAQTVGRGMRHEEDYCETYLLDGSFGSLYDRNKSAFPDWFHKQLR